jgi:antitoxin (DNA-binding transcriptional repressor) of toxin-antitoxin stability system
MGVMAKDVIHVSDKEATSDFTSLLARVREGAEVVIEHDERPVAVVRSTEAFRGRLFQSPSLWQKRTQSNWVTSQRWTRNSPPSCIAI